MAWVARTSSTRAAAPGRSAILCAGAFALATASGGVAGVGATSPAMRYGVAPASIEAPLPSVVSTTGSQPESARACTSNSVVLFRVRGSGEATGTDKLSQWAAAARVALEDKGWKVTSLQGNYDAPKLPSLSSVPPMPMAGVILAMKRYRDIATNQWSWV